jgi:hypothetical protein
MTKIILHDGKAHHDEFLGGCVLLHKLNCPIYRRPYTQEDLKNPGAWVLDQGKEYNKELHNFDHHQLNEPICSFTMVLDCFYENIDYRSYFPQLRFIEIYDSFGPRKAADFVGVTNHSLEITSSPISIFLLSVFSKINGEIKSPFYELMKEIGSEICSKIENTEFLLRQFSRYLPSDYAMWIYVTKNVYTVDLNLFNLSFERCIIQTPRIP